MRGTGHFLNALTGIVELSAHSKRNRRPEPNRRCPGGCQSRNACRCYGTGCAHGRDNAHSEVRAVLNAGHAGDCNCEPCQTVNAIALTLTSDAISITAAMCLPKDWSFEDRAAAAAEIAGRITNSDWFDQQSANGMPGKMIADSVSVAVAAAERVALGETW